MDEFTTGIVGLIFIMACWGVFFYAKYRKECRKTKELMHRIAIGDGKTCCKTYRSK